MVVTAVMEAMGDTTTTLTIALTATAVTATTNLDALPALDTVAVISASTLADTKTSSRLAVRL